MERDEARQLVRETVRETLLEIGLNTADADHVTEVQEDFAYLRKARVGSEEAGKWVKRSAVGVGVTTAFYVAWQGLKAALFMKTGS